MVVEKAAEAASKAASNDIAVFRTRFDVETGKGRKKRLVPVEAELHVNPVSILFAAAAGLAGALFATVAWHGINIPAPLGGAIELMPGIKDTTLGQDINAWYERQKRKRREAETRKNLDKAIALGVLDPDLIDPDECIVLKALFDAESNRTFRQRFKDEARDKGCTWAQ